MVECGGLENRCTERYRGFKSYFLRQTYQKPKQLLFRLFFMPVFTHSRIQRLPGENLPGESRPGEHHPDKGHPGKGQPDDLPDEGRTFP